MDAGCMGKAGRRAWSFRPSETVDTNILERVLVVVDHHLCVRSGISRRRIRRRGSFAVIADSIIFL
jgi:hypothetical protein